MGTLIEMERKPETPGLPLTGIAWAILLELAFGAAYLIGRHLWRIL